MTNFYATHDFDNGSISENATIAAFSTRADAVNYLLSPFQSNEWDKSSAVIEAGEFGDCWIKTYGPVKNVDIGPFKKRDLIIRTPGSHPGGNATWISPNVPVLVVSKIDEVE